MFSSLSSFSVSSFALSSLQTQTPSSSQHQHQHHSGSFSLVGCNPAGFVVFFFFFCCDRCLKEEVGMAEVGYGSWFSQVRCCWVLLVVSEVTARWRWGGFF
ncbi:hypothetical protein ACB092_01G227400 [Castanea dentata]